MSTIKIENNVNIICPYCKVSFHKPIENHNKQGLYSLLIKNHPKDQNCPQFVAYIDKNGAHRGSQKIDNVDEDSSINSHILENVRNNINEIEDKIRFFHLKVSKPGGSGFEHKVANVKDRAFMSSSFYRSLINFLSFHRENNTFGIIDSESDEDFEGGSLIYGKYLGIIFTLFWRDQDFLQIKTLESIKSYANVTVEKLIDAYDLVDFFF